MRNDKDYEVILKSRQEQMLKMVSKSFYHELLNFGINTSDLVTVSLHLLDNITTEDKIQLDQRQYYDRLFHISDIKDNWATEKRLQVEEVSLTPVQTFMIPQIYTWLQNPKIRDTFVAPFPDEKNALSPYLLEEDGREYFAIHYQDEFVGLIGAENIDPLSRKLEMRKFVGNTGMQGKGIGKRATFLFLYYAFRKMEFNKVYIHSMNTNIGNLNLNSKFGFELEGIFFNDTVLQDEYRDVVRMGLLRTIWDQIFIE